MRPRSDLARTDPLCDIYATAMPAHLCQENSDQCNSALKREETQTPAPMRMNAKEMILSDTARHGRTRTGTHSHEVPASSDSWTWEDMHWDPLPRGSGIIRLMDTGGCTLGPTPTRSQRRQTHGHGRTCTGTHSLKVPGSSDSRTREDVHWDPLPRGPGSSDSRTQKDTHWDPLTRRPGVVRLMDTGGHILGPTPTQSWGRQTHNTGGHAVGPSHTRSQGRQTHRVDSGARAGGARGESVCNRTGSQCGKMERSGAGQWGQLQST